MPQHVVQGIHRTLLHESKNISTEQSFHSGILGNTEKRFYVAFMAIGGLCLAIGMSIPKYGIVVQGIGGAILGAALSNFLTIVNRQDFYGKIYSLLTESLQSQLLSEEDAVSQYASMQTLYQYHLTRTKIILKECGRSHCMILAAARLRMCSKVKRQCRPARAAKNTSIKWRPG
jgi:hypothetical protein